MNLSKRINLIALAIFAGAIIVLPLLITNSYHLLILNVVGLNSLVVIGLNLLIGYAGQISLGQAAFFGLGAYISGILTTLYRFPPWPTILIALATTGLVAYIIGIPIMKLKGHYLVMATLGSSIIIHIFMVQMEGLTGGPSGLSGIPHLSLGEFKIDSDLRNFYLIWLCCFLSLLLSLNLINSRVGRALRALHSSEVAANTSGVDTALYKVKVFALSAIFASLAGSLYAHYLTFISPRSFDFFYSIQVVTMVVVGGMGNIWGSLFGAALLTALPEILQVVEEYQVLLYGLTLMAVLIFFPQGMLWELSSLFKKGRGEISPMARELRSNDLLEREYETREGKDFFLLRVEEIEKKFGGIKALNRVSFKIAKGEIVALIGPNGAGKTTAINLITGIYFPDSGSILFEDRDIVGLKPFEITHLGISRTFQHLQIFSSLTTLENVMVGFHSRTKVEFLRALFPSPRGRREERIILKEALEILDWLNLFPKAHWLSSSLPFYEQKLLEIARALANRPRLLLLDEPVAGLNLKETEEMSRLILKIKGMGISVILVEHNMDFVMGISDRVVVLNYGEKIAEGTPREVQRNPEVIKAYLGVRLC